MRKPSTASIIFLIVATAVLIPLVIVFPGRQKKSVVQPVISFIGASTGTLATDVRAFKFSDHFSANDRQIVVLVSFKQISDATNVVATWFSPDDRSMPIGRKTIVTASGATMVRFSIASSIAWKPAPYKVLIDVVAQQNPHAQPMIASGSLQFFIGMRDDEIKQYRDAYAAWKKTP